MNKPFTYFFILLMLFCREAKTQTNLVPNGSFELFDICPNNQGQVTGYVQNWFDPTYSSSDYYNTCSINGITSIPNNFFGYKNVLFGNAYCGLVNYHELINDYREYIGVKLNEKLLKDSLYSFSAYVSSSNLFKFSVNNFDICLLNDTTGIYSFFQIPISWSIDTSINFNSSDTTKWIKVAATIKSKQNASFLILGNFKNNINTTTTVIDNSGLELSYIYIDSVSIYKKENLQKPIIPNVFTPNSDEVNDVWRCNFSAFENVNCSIYNRWGNLIFQSNKQIIQWDGRTTSGINCEDGIYFYCIETETEKHKGHIQLIR